MSISSEHQRDLALIRRDKYSDFANADLSEDEARLAAGEPLAYIIGWIPFLGLKIYLDSHPLIPRPETEWWTEKLIAHLEERFGNSPEATPFTVLDLCAGSGAIGLSILAHFPNAHVSFGEIVAEHATLITKNIQANNLNASRATIRTGDLFEPFPQEHFDVIVTNPPYIPDTRELPEAVLAFEPSEALFSGPTGLEIITRVITDVHGHLTPNGELWMECDISNIHEAETLLRASGAGTAIHDDLYGRPRLIVGHFT